MSIGLAGFSTGIAIGKQGTNGTNATAFLLLPMEDTDSLTMGQSYIERNAAYGLRTRTADMHRRDYTMPGGASAAWAVGFDGTSLALNYMLRSFFQNFAVAAQAGTGAHAWAFTPHTTNKTIGNYTHLTAVKVTGLTGTRNLWLTDCLTTSLAGNWSAGNPMTLKPTYQAMTGAYAGTPTGWGAAPLSLSLIGAAEQAWVVGLNGTDYTVYPSDLSWEWTYNAEDLPGAGKASRARITPNALTGNCSLTVPRNSDLYNITEGGDTYGTITCTLTPGISTGSGAPVSSVMRHYGKITRIDLPGGQTGDVTDTLEMTVMDCSWSLVSNLGSAVI